MSNIAVAPHPVSESLWQRLWSRKYRNYYIAFLFILPAIINFIVFRYLPILAALQASLWQYSLLGGYRDFNGITHYVNMVSDPIFWKSMQVTIVFVILKVPIQVAISLVLAVFLAKENWLTGLVRGAVFVPVVTSVIVVSILWSMMYHAQLGLINSLLSLINIPPQRFLSDPNRALPAVTIMMIWKEIGFSMIILMAGLKGIPTMYKEAAVVDGAKAWQIFLYITMPLLKRVMMFVVVTQTIFSFQVFVPRVCHDQRGAFGCHKGDRLLYLSVRLSLSRYGVRQCPLNCNLGASIGRECGSNANVQIRC